MPKPYRSESVVLKSTGGGTNQDSKERRFLVAVRRQRETLSFDLSVPDAVRLLQALDQFLARPGEPSPGG